MKNTFQGHDVEQKGTDPPIRYTMKSVSCMESSFGAATQNFCCEMLRWDDYRQVTNVQDGTPSMVSLFCPNGQYLPPFRGHTVPMPSQNGSNDVLVKCIIATDELQGSKQQDFSIEMLRYDDYAAIGLITTPAGEKKMVDLFFKPPPFAAHVVEIPLTTGEKSVCYIKCITSTPAKCGAASQNMSPEMLRWDDVRAAANIADGLPTMASIFGA